MSPETDRPQRSKRPRLLTVFGALPLASSVVWWGGEMLLGRLFPGTGERPGVGVAVHLLMLLTLLVVITAIVKAYKRYDGFELGPIALVVLLSAFWIFFGFIVIVLVAASSCPPHANDCPL